MSAGTGRAEPCARCGYDVLYAVRWFRVRLAHPHVFEMLLVARRGWRWILRPVWVCSRCYREGERVLRRDDGRRR
jgi:hypothetical protein